MFIAIASTAAAVALVALALGLARRAGQAERTYPAQPKGLAHHHDVGTGPIAPPRDAEILTFPGEVTFREDDER